MYSDRYVAFVDILGFSDIVRRSEKDQTTIRIDALAKALVDIGAWHPSINESDDFQFQSFSDSIVMSSAATLTGLAHIFYSITELTLRLLSDGLLIRGAVAKGKLHHKQAVIFGPSLLEAYNLEHTIAKYPRVVLSREVYRDFHRVADSYIFPKIRLDEDGPPFLDTLAGYSRLNEGEPTPEFLNSPEILAAQVCQRALQNAVDESIYDPRHYEKLRWLAVYWNSTVASPASRGALGMIVLPLTRNFLLNNA
jgi:hypothetical protein